jgi:uncharacterized SAM-binding protein YcdF (DUF218 family)
VVLFTLLGLSAWLLLAWAAALALVIQVRIEPADAIVVLSGSAAYLERTRHAARLFREGNGLRVIVTNDRHPSGWSEQQQRNPLFVELAIDELRHSGVPPERIEVVPRPVSDTYDEVTAVREYVLRQQVRSILVVTSGYHSRRAWWTMRRVLRESGVTIGIAAVAPGWQTPNPLTWWCGVKGWESVAGEYVKMAYYWLRYR